MQYDVRCGKKPMIIGEEPFIILFFQGRAAVRNSLNSL
jgi:hypothetical protein